MARSKKEEATTQIRPTVRCAVYTRKSTDENLDSDFNSLDAQRDAGESYIKSQRHEGWVVLPERYDDGAYSGATLERPALQRLRADIHAGRVDAIVVYKIDRLSRSLLDFTRLTEELEQSQVSLVSVTQQFSTTTSMGKLVMNVLLSFAQFEREVTAERIRDKIAAEKRRGRYLGGVPPLGYDVDRERKRLIVDPDEAELVQLIFRRFSEIGSVTALAQELNDNGHRTKSWTTKKGRDRPGRPWNKAHIYRLLTNPTCLGLVKHKDKTYPGLHDAIIEQVVWDKVQAVLSGNEPSGARPSRARTPALLKGIIRCGHCGTSMGITFARKNGRTYRYYLCLRANKQGYTTCPLKTVSAGTVENAVTIQLRKMFHSPEEVAEILGSMQDHEAAKRQELATKKQGLIGKIKVIKTDASRLVQGELDGDNGFVREELARLEGKQAELEEKLRSVEWELDSSARAEISTETVIAELTTMNKLWDDLFPAEQERIIRLLVEEVIVHGDHLEIAIRPNGLRTIVSELTSEDSEHATRSNAGGTVAQRAG